MINSSNSIKAIKNLEGCELIAAVAPERPPQTIRGGFIVVRRKGGDGRLRKIADQPYEHASQEEAEAQAAVLAARHGGEFSVFHQVATVLPPVAQEGPRPALVPTPAPLPIAPAHRRPVVVERRASRAVKQGGRS